MNEPRKTRPSDATLLKHLVPRLKELKAAGCRVYVEFDGMSHEVNVDENDKPYASVEWLGPHRTYLNRYFFDKMYSPIRGRDKDFVPNYDLQDAMEMLWVEVTVSNYRDKVTALTQKP